MQNKECIDYFSVFKKHNKMNCEQSFMPHSTVPVEFNVLDWHTRAYLYRPMRLDRAGFFPMIAIVSFEGQYL